MSAIRIMIGAALDASVARSFTQVEQAAVRASGRIRQSSRQTSKQQAQDSAQGAAQATAAEEKKANAIARAMERANAQIARVEARGAAEADRRRQANVRADMRAFDQKARAAKKAHDAEERDIMRVAAAAERADKRKAAAAERDQRKPSQRYAFARDFGHRAVANLGDAARFGMGVGSAALRGAGINGDVGSLTSRAVDLESQVAKTTRSAFAAQEKTATGSDVRDTMAAVQKAGDDSSTGYGEMAAGLDRFVGKTGDLKTAKALLAEMGKLSKATGADLSDMLSTGGEVSNQFKNVEAGEKRAAAVAEVMRGLAKQGASGAVEIADLGQYGSRLAAPASAYAGPREKSIAQLGALAQMAKAEGGATDAAEATNSAAAFTRDLTKKTNLKHFADAGINVFADKGNTQLNSAQEIIKAMLAKTGGDKGKLAAILPNSASMRAVTGFANKYNEAGGGKAGLEAVDKAFKELAGSISKADVEKSFAGSKDTMASKAQDAQNRLDKLAGQTLERLMPSLEKLAPAAASVAEAFAYIVEQASKHPVAAITAAIVLAIGKAFAGAAITAQITKSMMGGGGGGVPGLPGGAPGGAAGMGRVLPVAAAGLLGWGIGAAIDTADEEAQRKGFIGARAGSNRISNARTELLVGMGESSKETDPIMRSIHQKEMLDRARKTLSTEEAKANQADPRSWMEKNSPTGKYEAAAINAVGQGVSWLTSGSAGVGWGRSLDETQAIEGRAAESDNASKEIASLKAAIEAMSAKLSGNLNVTVTSMPGGAPTVDAGGRDALPKP